MRAFLAFLLLVFGWRVRPGGRDELDEAVRGLWSWCGLIVAVLLAWEVAHALGAVP